MGGEGCGGEGVGGGDGGDGGGEGGGVGGGAGAALSSMRQISVRIVPIELAPQGHTWGHT